MGQRFLRAEVMRRVSPIRFFDASMLALARWVAQRYVTTDSGYCASYSAPSGNYHKPAGNGY